MNGSSAGAVIPHEYDHLTGLLSFARFREEVERIIAGGYARSYAMVYSDFETRQLWTGMAWIIRW